MLQVLVVKPPQPVPVPVLERVPVQELGLMEPQERLELLPQLLPLLLSSSCLSVAEGFLSMSLSSFRPSFDGPFGSFRLSLLLLFAFILS